MVKAGRDWFATAQARRTLNRAMLLVVVQGTSATRTSGGLVDTDGPVGRFHVQGASGVDDADVDPLTGQNQGASAGHAPLDPDRLGRRDWWRPGRAGVADPGDLRRGQWVGQAAQQDAVRGQLQHAVVDPNGDAPAGELDPDGCCRPARATSPQALTSRSTSTGPPGITGAIDTGDGPAGLPPSASS